jgi:tight adherence protein B
MSSSPIILPAAIFIGVLAMFMAIMALAGRRGATARRLEAHVVPVEVTTGRRIEHVHVLRDQHYSPLRIWDAVLRRFKPARTAHEELTRANAWLSVSQYLMLRGLVAAILFVAMSMLTGIPLLGLPAIPIGLMLPRIGLRFLARRRRQAFEKQLAEGIDLIVGALRAGYGFLQAIESVSKEVENPMREEFVQIMEQVNLGASPTDALQELPNRIASYDLSLFVTAVTVQRSVGGNLAEVLENIAATVRERRRIRAEVRAITTGPRASSYVLGFLPIGLMTYFSLIDENYRIVMLDSTFGRMMLGFAIFWSLLGLVISTMVSKVEY